MEFESVQILAGFASTAIFASSKVPMLAKALSTRDLHSYSVSHIGLSAGGNLIYWLYVVSLPMGPIWLLQAFFTLADLLMLSFYGVYELRGTSRLSQAVDKLQQLGPGRPAQVLCSKVELKSVVQTPKSNDERNPISDLKSNPPEPSGDLFIRILAPRQDCIDAGQPNVGLSLHSKGELPILPARPGPFCPERSTIRAPASA